MRTLALALALAATACGPLPTNRTGEVPSIKWLREWIGPAADPRGGGSRLPDYEVLDRHGKVIGTIRSRR